MNLLAGILSSQYQCIDEKGRFLPRSSDDSGI